MITPCELCDRKGELLKKQVLSSLEGWGIRPETFLSATPWQRLSLLRDHLQLAVPDNVATKFNSNLGLIVVKPEAVGFSNLIEEDLTKRLGLEIVSTTNFTYTPENYWTIYGKNFIDYFSVFPHGALLFLISTHLPSRSIVFKHLTATKYCELKRGLITPQQDDSIPKVVGDFEDPQDYFDKLFIRDGSTSIRKTVCSPILESKGFSEMDNATCPGKCWDFTGTFSKREPQANLITFNGIHCPSNRQELAVAFNIIPVKI